MANAADINADFLMKGIRRNNVLTDKLDVLFVTLDEKEMDLATSIILDTVHKGKNALIRIKKNH